MTRLTLPAAACAGLAFLLLGCEPHPPAADLEYVAEIEAWHARRVDDLKGESGWLNLVGLFWLEPGSYTFGSDSTNDLVFPPQAPPRIGVLEVGDSLVTARIDPEASVFSGGEPVNATRLKDDTSTDPDAPTVLEWDHLRWWAIARDGRLGIRLRDLQSPAATAFPGIERYPIDPRWRLDARLVPHAEPRMLTMPTVMGTQHRELSPGSLVFVVEGDTMRLDPMVAASGRLFIIFGDRTTGSETYGGGRYLYADAPDANGHTTIDFNKAYNPPCAFSEFSTCSQPPAQNYLPVPVRAGEKAFHVPD